MSTGIADSVAAVNCPGCGQGVTVRVEDASESVTCPHCATGFVPEVVARRRSEVRRGEATAADGLGIFLMAFGVIMALVMFLMAMRDNEHWRELAGPSCGLFFAGVLLAILGQLIRIRRAMEQK